MSRPTSRSSWLDVLITALAPAIWGSTYIVTTEILPPDRPFTAALLRALPAGLLLVLYSRYLPRCSEWPRLLVLAALNIGFFQALLFASPRTACPAVGGSGRGDSTTAGDGPSVVDGWSAARHPWRLLPV